MSIQEVKLSIGVVVLSALTMLPIGCAQTHSRQSSSTTDLEVEQLKKNMIQLQTDVAEMKQVLSRRPVVPTPKPISKLIRISLEGISFLGRADAPLTMVEYTDYHCPFCRRHARNTLPKLFRTYIDTGKLRYGIRDFPQTALHPDAFRLSEAALCAGDQGKYWQMHHEFMKGSGNADVSKLADNVLASKLDAQEFSACMDSNQHTSDLRATLDAGQELGVRGTPYFFIGESESTDDNKLVVGSTVRGAQPYSVFKSRIDELLETNIARSGE
jgi:protein-disulfide isomerase